MHAITKANEEEVHVTLPTSRSVTKEKQKKVIGEMNVYKKGSEVAKQMMELGKQRRVLDKRIHKLEIELSGIFDNEGIDTLELEMGVLVRRRTNDVFCASRKNICNFEAGTP